MDLTGLWSLNKATKHTLDDHDFFATGSGNHPAWCTVGIDTISPKVERPKREADHFFGAGG
jgi:hypothetical protein